MSFDINDKKVKNFKFLSDDPCISLTEHHEIVTFSIEFFSVQFRGKDFKGSVHNVIVIFFNVAGML